MLLSILFMFACSDATLNYQCTCTRIAYEKLIQEQEEEEYLVGYLAIEDQSFSENVCDTYENMQLAFESGGVIAKGITACETEMTEIAEEEVGAGNYAIDCSCECTFLSEC